MKKITFSQSGHPEACYKPVCVMANNDQIRRCAEIYLADEYDPSTSVRHIWIDQHGSGYAYLQDDIPTDLYVCEDECGIYIQNSVYRG